MVATTLESTHIYPPITMAALDLSRYYYSIVGGTRIIDDCASRKPQPFHDSDAHRAVQ